MLAKSTKYCVYKGVSYLQGQEWEDGCSFKCRCDDSSRGIYTCNQRCASIDQNLQAGCTLRTDPRDACCLAQFCVQTTPVPQPGVSYGPTPVPTLKPNTFTGKVYLPTPSPIPGQPTSTPGQLGVCIYKGRQYSQGQTFEDGCDFDCVCFNANEGKYRCSPKCPVYTDIPNTCRLVKNPRKPCCQIPECYNLPTQNPTGQPTPSPLPYTGQPTPSPTPYTGQPTQAPTPYNGQPTPSPTPYHGPPTPSPKPYTGQPTQPPHITPQHIPQRTVQPTQRPTPQPQPTQPINVCVYKGIAYSQGQQWYDGCDYSCVCEDGITGVYRCNNSGKTADKMLKADRGVLEERKLCLIILCVTLNTQYYDSLLGQKNLLKSIDKAEELAESLKERYEEIEAKLIAEKLSPLDSSPPINGKVDSPREKEETDGEQKKEEKEKEKLYLLISNEEKLFYDWN
ncbi:unnamed protein product [Mytilus edulis]|uniref:VWFC domain-containing protein n=1 Tax=Mytilus edulis TaxID=6550 RepID=A0A8S3V4X7_MYTED|nr:unnamed protein product [Mytilus edulis]